jgi:hypothetical protein
MPFNGAGTFTVYTPGNPIANGDTSNAVYFNNTMTDFATGLSNTMTKDGQGVPTANIPMGNNKLTGLANGTISTDAINFGQLAALNASKANAGANTDITSLSNVTVPTQTAGNSSGLIANTAFVTGALANVSSKQIQNISAVASSNTMIVGLNPTTLDFRSTNLTSGVINTRTLGTLTNLTIPQGATLGAPSGNLTRISVGAIDNNGTIEPVVGGANINFDGSTLVNITAISNASNASNVLYGTTSRSLVPLRYMGFLDSNQSSAGVYAAQPLLVQGAGGSAPQVGQWQYKRYPVVSTASGTSIDPFGGETINSQAKRITLNYVALSQASGDYFMFRLGTAGGLISTGYVGGVSTNGASVSNVTGFEIETRVDAAAKYSGKAVLELQDPVTNTWTISGTSFNEANDVYSFSGHIILSGLLTQIRLTTPTAVTLDNGSISGMVEY